MPNQPNQPNKLSKSMMNSPYYQGYSQYSQAKPKTPQVSRVGSVPQQVGGYPGNLGYTNGYPMQPQRGVPNYSPAGAVVPAKVAKKTKKKRKKFSSHFYLQRKGATFLICILCLVCLAIISVGSMFLPAFTSFVSQPDYTPEDERGEEYEDKAVHYSFLDITFGMLKKVAGVDLYTPQKEDIDKQLEEETITQEEADEMMNSIAIFQSEFYDKVVAEIEKSEDAGIFGTLFIYSPIFFILIVLMLFFTIIKCIGSFFGRRVFKRFGLTAILMAICSVVLALAGLIGYSFTNIVPEAESIVNFENLIPFITELFNGVPATAPGADAILPLAMTIGYGVLISIGISVVILILSMFARKKLSYSIFDR